jgi:hypothetical protein
VKQHDEAPFASGSVTLTAHDHEDERNGLNQIAGASSRSIAFHLVMEEMTEPILRALYMANSYEFPDRWSLTEETSTVEFDWADGGTVPMQPGYGS